MSRFAASSAWLIGGTVVAVLAALPAAAQTPQRPLGQLLDVLPLPEPTPIAMQVGMPGPGTTDDVGLINPEDYPDDGSLAGPEPDDGDTIEAEIARREAELADIRAQRRDKVDAVEAPITARLNEAEARRAATARRSYENAAEAPVTARLNEAEAARTGAGQPGIDSGRRDYASEFAAARAERRSKLDAVEAPITAQLNDAEAARADVESRRYADERAAYERDLGWREQQAEAERIAYWNRVERDRAEYRARVRACLAGDRYACGDRYGGPAYGGRYGAPVYGRPYYFRPFSRY